MGCNCSKKVHKNQICQNILKVEADLQFQKVTMLQLQEALDYLLEQKQVDKSTLIKYLKLAKVANIQNLNPSDNKYRLYCSFRALDNEEYFSKQKIILLSILLCSANPKERARLFWDYYISPNDLKIEGAQTILSKLTQFTSDIFVIVSELSYLCVGTKSNAGIISRTEVEQFMRECWDFQQVQWLFLSRFSRKEISKTQFIIDIANFASSIEPQDWTSSYGIREILNQFKPRIKPPLLENDPNLKMKNEEKYEEDLDKTGQKLDSEEKVSISSSPRLSNIKSYTPSQVSNQDTQDEHFRQKSPFLAYELASAKSKSRTSFYPQKVYQSEQRTRDEQEDQNWGESIPESLRQQDKALLELAIQQRFKNQQDRTQSSTSSGQKRELEKTPMDYLKFLKEPLPDFNNPLVKEVEEKLPAFEFVQRPDSPTKITELDPVQLHNGAIYVGKWNELAKRHGQGMQIWPDGSKYIGNWKNDKANGQGRRIFSDGDVYEGNYLDNKQHGKGKMILHDGTVYQGDFLNDKKHGYGIETWVDKAQYKGNYINGKKQGKGLFIWANGNYYEGEFQENQIFGKGIFSWKDGKRYEGQMQRGKMHGQGICIYPDGKAYYGEFYEDRKHGYGILSWPDGRKYEGFWRNGKQHGKGVYYSVGGKMKMEGTWENGKQVKRTKQKN